MSGCDSSEQDFLSLLHTLGFVQTQIGVSSAACDGEVSSSVALFFFLFFHSSGTQAEKQLWQRFDSALPAVVICFDVTPAVYYFLSTATS